MYSIKPFFDKLEIQTTGLCHLIRTMLSIPPTIVFFLKDSVVLKRFALRRETIHLENKERFFLVNSEILVRNLYYV